MSRSSNDQNNNSKYGTFTSWTVIDDATAVKKCDKSFFEYRGSGVPQGIRWFFDADSLGLGEKQYIDLEFYGMDYKARIQRESLELGRTRIFWETALADKFEDYNDPEDYPSLYFNKLTSLKYKVSFDKENKARKGSTTDKQDEELLSDIRRKTLKKVAPGFIYKGESRKKPDPINLGNRRTYPRDRKTSINALSHAFFKCEIDNDHYTFIRRNSDKPYTEPHHLVPMEFSDKFDVSLDVEENIVSLCSNCHNEIHYGRDANELVERLYKERKEALESVGIVISLSELLKMYT